MSVHNPAFDHNDRHIPRTGVDVENIESCPANTKKSGKLKGTRKQTEFITGVIQGKTMAQAAREAGYSDSSGAARVRAAELVANSSVQAIIEQEKQAIAKRNAVTQDTLLAELEAARSIAESKRDASAMTGATVAKGKLTGHFIDRTMDMTKRSDAEVLEQLYEAGVLWELIELHRLKTGVSLANALESPSSGL